MKFILFKTVTKDDYGISHHIRGYPFGLWMLKRGVNPYMLGPGLPYNNGNQNDRLKFQSKRLQDYGNWKTYYFGWRDYDPELGRWFVVDPARQFASPYVGMGNNPVLYYDENGELAWLVPIIVNAVINVATNWNNIHDPGDFFSYAGVGTAQGAAYLIPGVGSTIGGIIGSVGNAYLGGARGGALIQAEFTGGFAGALGGAVGCKVGGLLKNFNFSFNGYEAPFIDGFIKGAISGGAGGAAGGAIRSYYVVRESGNFLDAFYYYKGDYRSRVARYKGNIGEAKMIKNIEKAGGKILGRQVTVDIGGVRTRVDFVAEINGEVVLFEAKNGTYAKLTKNQFNSFNNFENGSSVILKSPKLIQRGFYSVEILPVNRIEINHYKTYNVNINVIYPIR